jgi:hypothetical protein
MQDIRHVDHPSAGRSPSVVTGAPRREVNEIAAAFSANEVKDYCWMLHGSQREEMISKAQELEGRAEVVRSVTPHWGRHNLASHAFVKGMDTEKVRRLGNWQTDAMVRRYQHLKPDFGKGAG